MSAWVLAGVILTGAWTQLDELGWAGSLPLVVTFALDRASQTRLAVFQPRRSAIELAPLLGCALLCLLILSHVAVTADEEFAFGSDEGYHLSATRAFALYYLRAGPMLAAVITAFAVWRWRAWPYAASAAMAGLLAASYFLPASALFGRYPAGYYHLATPLSVLFDIAGIPYPFTANHIVNALSVPAWLFVLRPWVLGRWPDWHVLPVALLVYFQAPALTYVGSALLEPWAFVFLLLALEALAALDREARWIAVPLAATAVFFKETAILLLPAVWLVACVDWTGLRPSLRRGAIALGAASVVPFLVYYSVRRGLQIDRSFELAAAGDVWTRARVAEWLSNVHAQIGSGGAAAIILAGAVAVTMRQWIWIATAAAITLFFFGDAASIPYTGYGRFVAYALLAICGAVFAATHHSSVSRRQLIGFTLVVAALQLVPFSRTLALDFGPDFTRNSLEWNGASIRLPIRALTERLAEARDSDQVRTIRVVSFATDLTSLHVAYPDLAERFALVPDRQRAPAIDCRCRDNAEAVLAAFEWPAHFGDTPSNRSTFNQVSAACVSQLNTTCRATTLERHAGGAVVGALGVGRAVLIALPQYD